MPERKFKTGKAFLTVCLLILLSLLAYGFVELNRKSPLPPLPNPNGYDDLVKAQKLMVGNPADFKHGSMEDLRKLVAVNAELLKLVRVGLAKQCRISLSFTTNYLDLR